MDRTKVAQKAVRTRKAREEFRSRYGSQVFDIIACLRANCSVEDTAADFDISASRVRAIKAHLSRGTYCPKLLRRANI